MSDWPSLDISYILVCTWLINILRQQIRLTCWSVSHCSRLVVFCLQYSLTKCPTTPLQLKQRTGIIFWCFNSSHRCHLCAFQFDEMCLDAYNSFSYNPFVYNPFAYNLVAPNDIYPSSGVHDARLIFFIKRATFFFSSVWSRGKTLVEDQFCFGHQRGGGERCNQTHFFVQWLGEGYVFASNR